MANNDVFDTFEEEVKNRHNEMISELEKISVDSIKSEGVTLSFGGKTFKFTDLEVIPDESLEDKIRNEYKEKLNLQQQKIRERINSKINQLLIMHQNKQQEMDRKEKALKKKYSEAAMMPEINQNDFAAGLSVVKGSHNDELIWMYRGIYNPRFITVYDYDRTNSKGRKPIPSRIVKRMKKDVIFGVKTKGNKIVDVSVHVISSGRLSHFDHYHYTGSGDCWGSWKFKTSWNTPKDVLLVAKSAEAILETINQGSIARRNPTSLPRLETLLRSIENVEELQASTVEREGGNTEEDDVWQSV